MALRPLAELALRQTPARSARIGAARRSGSGTRRALLDGKRTGLGLLNPSYHCIEQAANGSAQRLARPGQGPGSPLRRPIVRRPAAAARAPGPSPMRFQPGSTDRARQTPPHGVPTSVIASTWRGDGARRPAQPQRDRMAVVAASVVAGRAVRFGVGSHHQLHRGLVRRIASAA